MCSSASLPRCPRIGAARIASDPQCAASVPPATGNYPRDQGRKPPMAGTRKAVDTVAVLLPHEMEQLALPHEMERRVLPHGMGRMGRLARGRAHAPQTGAQADVRAPQTAAATPRVVAATPRAVAP